MAKGTAYVSAWDLWVSKLRLAKSKYRMIQKKGKRFLYVREIRGGKPAKEFSSVSYRPEIDEDIHALGQLCLESSKAGRWLTANRPGLASKSMALTWAMVVERARENLRARVAREGSRKNAEGHLTEIGKFSGKVSVKTLEAWALERDPVTQPSAFRNRVETLSHINKAGDLELDATIASLKAKRPTGAAKKEQERRTQKVRAIPTDEALEAWLDDKEGYIQWTLAMISTYGLRPSETWHITEIDEDGWATIPGDGATKTETHFARPVPEHFVERYKLRENFTRYQAELQQRWPIRWQDRAGLMIPLNNSQVSNALYQELEQQRVSRLYVGEEWLRPYDLRHAYAIRCETSEDLISIPSEEFARYLGHGFEVHKRIYLKHMSPDRQKRAQKARGEVRHKESPTTGAELPDDVLAKLKKLEQLEKLLSS